MVYTALDTFANREDAEYTEYETFDQPVYSSVGTKAGRARNKRRIRRQTEEPTVSGEPSRR